VNETVTNLLALRGRLEAAIADRDAARRGWQEAKHAAERLDDDLAHALDEAVRTKAVAPGKGYRVGGRVVSVSKVGGARGGRPARYALHVVDAPDEET
jgi:hypothetical protein